jgi:ribosomal protein L11 methyltransferase
MNDSKIHWLEVKLTSNGEIAEALADVLGRFVSNGVVVENITQFNPHTQENEPTGELMVFGYLPADEDLENKQRKIEEALWHLNQIAPIPTPIYTPVKDENWMAAWKQHYHPITVGDRILILPAWLQPENKENRITIRINPAMAFGTGSHPTTQLCLGLLEKHIQPGSPVIDVGCGSGILSIAALKLGATHVLGVDVDSQSVLSTIENAGLNDISPLELETGKGSVEEILTGRFSIQKAPLVLVNILAPIIMRLFDQGLAKLVEPDGTLCLSGILDHQEAAVLESAEAAGFKVVDRLTQDDWVSMAMERTHLGDD